MPQLLSFHFGKKKLWSQDALDFFPFKKVFIFSRFSQEGQTKEQKILKKLQTFVSRPGNAKSKIVSTARHTSLLIW